MNTPLGRAVMMDFINHMKPEKERVAPDKRGCETIFAKAFGYIHGVNIEANVKQMWEEVCS